MQLAHLVEMEVKHRCNQILELGFPLGGLARLFAQEWEGDVTVVMPATLAQVCIMFSILMFEKYETAYSEQTETVKELDERSVSLTGIAFPIFLYKVNMNR